MQKKVINDYLDLLDSQREAIFTEINGVETSILWQRPAEDPFGTIKRWWDGDYFLTRGLEKVSTETALTYMAYNFKRVVNILGVEEMVRRLQERGKPVLA